ncbi:unnamed protein product [Parnassius mnemosyne]|uniref:DDE Tnp4 domain-containing protein n=1 Tax=Parnassius mnemosyne TaxID=213953 RepID=A0AAV1LKQ4_9NEOP
MSRARRTVENAFGILSARFRVLRATISLDPEKTTTLIMTCVLLHNFLRKTGSSMIYAPSQYYDSEDEITDDGREIRKEFAEYFSNEGLLDWASKYY